MTYAVLILVTTAIPSTPASASAIISAAASTALEAVDLLAQCIEFLFGQLLVLLSLRKRCQGAFEIAQGAFERVPNAVELAAQYAINRSVATAVPIIPVIAALTTTTAAASGAAVTAVKIARSAITRIPFDDAFAGTHRLRFAPARGRWRIAFKFRFVVVIGIFNHGFGSAFAFGRVLDFVVFRFVFEVGFRIALANASAQFRFRSVFITTRRLFRIAIIVAFRVRRFGAGKIIARVITRRPVIARAATATTTTAPSARRPSAATATAIAFPDAGVGAAPFTGAGSRFRRARTRGVGRCVRIAGLGSGVRGGRRLARFEMGRRSRFGGAFRARRGC